MKTNKPLIVAGILLLLLLILAGYGMQSRAPQASTDDATSELLQSDGYPGDASAPTE